MKKRNFFLKHILTPVFIGLTVSLISTFVLQTFAAPPDSAYRPGETLNPSCSPGDTNCTVSKPVAYDATNINIPIGTTTAVSLLELYSTSTAPILTITAATSTTSYDPYLQFRTGAAPATKFVLGVDYSDSNKFKIATSTIGTNDILVIDQSGRIGIGTTTPSYALDVTGDIRATGNLVAAGQTIGGNLTVTGNTTLGDSPSDSLTINAAAINYGTSTSATSTIGQIVNAWSIATSTSAVPILSIDGANGRIGIGTTTPAYKLDVYGSARFGSATSTNVNFVGYVNSNILPAADATYNFGSSSFRWSNIYTATATIGSTITINSTDISASGALNFTGAAASTWRTSSGALTIASADTLTATSTGAMIFSTAGAERMRILSTSNFVGIGTTTPASFLDVAGTAQLRGFATSTTGLYVDASGNVGIGTTGPDTKLDIQLAGTAKSENPILELSNYHGATDNDGTETSIVFKHSYQAPTLGLSSAAKIIAGQENDWVGEGTRSGYLSFHTVLSGSIGERIRITSSGNVGIGTSTPLAKLEIATSTEQLRLSYGVNKYTSFTVGSNGELAIAPVGNTTTTISGPVILAGTSGNVGIGTTGPVAKLHVASGSINLDTSQGLQWGGNVNNSIMWDSTAMKFLNAGATNLRIINGHVTVGVDGDSGSKFGVSGNASIGSTYYTTAAPADGMIIQGNVGIGTTTPSSLLELSQASSTILTLTVSTSTTSYDPYLAFRTGVTPAIKFVLGVDYSDSNKFKIATTTIGTNDIFVIDQSGNLGIGTSTPATLFSVATSTNIFNVTSAGRVGVGTTTPTYALSVVGDIYGSGNAIFGGTVTAQGMSGTNFTGPVTVTTSTQPQFEIRYDTANKLTLSVGSTGAAIASSTATTTITTSAGAIILTPATYVGIGTTTPSYALDIVGTLRASATSTFSGNVGIGTTAPGAALDVNGNLLVQAGGTIDTRTAGTLAIGGATQTGLTLSRSGQSTTLAGNVQAFTLAGSITGSGSPNITGVGQFSGSTLLVTTATTTNLVVSALTTAGPVITTATGIISSEAQLAVSRGGTATSTTPVAGAMVYGNGSTYAFNVAGTTGQALLSGGTGVPTWTTGTLALASNFALSGTGGLTLTISTTTNATLPEGTITLADLATAQSFTNKTLTSSTNVLGGVTMTLTSDATGDIYYRSAGGVLTRLTIGTSAQVLHGGTTPSYSAVSLTADVSGILPFANGGTATSTAFTAGSVIFSDGSSLSQNNSNLYWDNTNNRLGIGTTTPAVALDIVGNLKGGYGVLTASGNGSLAYGYALGGLIQATATGSIALGYSKDSTTYILSSGIGSLAGGAGILSGAPIIASGSGSLAFGYSTSTGITASGLGSFALGGGGLTASGNNSFALGYGLTVSGNNSFGINLSTSTASTLSSANIMAIMGGNVGIGTTGPGRKLEVLYADSVAQLRLSQTGSVYSEFKVDSVGDLTVSATGGDIRINDENLWVCAGSACPTTGFSISGTGNLVVENKVIADKFEQICPTGYIWVPGAAKFGTLPGFCVMKYEAKNVGSVATSQATSSPWVSISQETARSTCQAVGTGYHLISEAEWMTIAENIANTTINDMDDDAGLQLATGHTDNAPATAATSTSGADPVVSGCVLTSTMENASNAYAAGTCEIQGDGSYGGDDNDKGYYMTGQNWSATGYSSGLANKSQLRTHILSNGNVIWDMAGSVWEWTDALIIGQEEPVDDTPGAEWLEYTAITKYNNLPYARPPDDGWSATNGIGRLYTVGSGTGTYAFFRGGSWGNEANAGVFTLDLTYAPTTADTDFGFRCAR